MLNSISESYNPLLEKASPTLTLDDEIADHSSSSLSSHFLPFLPKACFT